MTNEKRLGNKGEQLAKDYLISKNYEVIETNYRCDHFEIDIITRKNKNLIFFEVKTRLKSNLSVEEIPLSSWQIKNLKKAIVHYCVKNRHCLENTRLDLIIIIANQKDGLATLKHYLDIF